MKRIFIIILLSISILRIEANPIQRPTIEISELQFSTDGSWVLEIVVQHFSQSSIGGSGNIWIKSNSGESKLKHFEDNGYYKMFIVESDSLENPLFINPLQDSVSIICWDYEPFETLTYGYSDSKIRTPKAGQSIAYINGLYSITNSPTIGMENNTNGMLGTIRGMIYDKNGLPLTNMSNIGFTFVTTERNWGFTFYHESDGSYSTQYYSRDYIDIHNLNYRYGNSYRTVNITPIHFSMQPDSVVIRDIYLSDTIATVGVKEIDNKAESILRIYPQPIRQSFKYEISIPIKSVETYLVFSNINGQEVYRFLVTENQGELVLPESIKSGFYVVQLISNNKNYATTKVIVQ